MEIKNIETAYSTFYAFSKTEYGRELSDKIRYEKYNLAKLPNAEWISILGLDVDNLWHMMITFGLAQSFIEQTEKNEPGYFSEDEKTTLMLAAIIHDQGEAIIGDISYGDKNAAHEEQEKQALTDNTEIFTQGLSISTKQLITTARDKVVFDN